MMAGVRYVFALPNAVQLMLIVGHLLLFMNVERKPLITSQCDCNEYIGVMSKTVN